MHVYYEAVALVDLDDGQGPLIVDADDLAIGQAVWVGGHPSDVPVIGHGFGLALGDEEEEGGGEPGEKTAGEGHLVCLSVCPVRDERADDEGRERGREFARTKKEREIGKGGGSTLGVLYTLGWRPFGGFSWQGGVRK